jgi:hypothetical protein
MRLIAFGVGVAAVLSASSAWATGGVGGKGDTGNGKGGTGPENSTESGAAGQAEAGTTLDTTQQPFGGKSTQNPDTTGSKKVEEKPWEVGATFETHRLLRQDYNLDGEGALKVFNVLFAVVRYSFTERDSIALSGGGYQFFLADNGESGYRASDLSLGYTHVFNLPEKFRLRTSAGATIPISFDSQLATNITSPSVSVALSRKFGDLSVEARISGRYFWDRYTSANAIGASSSASDANSGAGSPNAKWSAGGAISAEYDMPFYRPISAGIALTDSYTTFYEVGSPPADTTFYGATTNPTVDGTTQPWLQSYGGEIFVRYVMPDLSGFKSDLTIALANGDPSLGYPSVLHDGIVHPYLLYYNSAEFYAALSARY